jgi:Na+-transporting NADH:ubiquinone oxidoreductase subunit A
MSVTVKLRKGFDLNLAGKAERKLGNAAQPETFAIKPTDFAGLHKIKLLVKEGDTVKAGTPLFFDRENERAMFVSPVSGEIAQIIRGEKRKLLEIRILADKVLEYFEGKKYSSSDISSIGREELQDTLLKSGVWPGIIQRPFGIVARPEETPKSIFISAFDTHPLAPDYNFVFKGEQNYFQAGINALKRLTPGKVHLNLPLKSEGESFFDTIQNVQINRFSGPHPSGNVGIQIHHIDPIKKGDVVWAINPYFVVQIGKYLLDGKYDASKIIAVAGSEVKTPQYYKTYSGAAISKLVENNLKNDHVRFISGNVLTGEKIEKSGYLGFYHSQLSIIPEGDYYEFLGWLLPSAKKISFHRAFGLFNFMKGGENVADTNLHGEERAFVASGVLEKVVPMDLYPAALIKSIMANDFDNMEALGILEVVEEDLALCEFIDVSKHEIQAILREGIEALQNS